MFIGKTLNSFRFIWIFLNVFLKIFHTVPVDRFIAVDISEMEESSYSSTKFLTVSIFSSIILVRGGPGSLEGEMSPETINLLITCRGCPTMKIIDIDMVHTKGSIQ